MGKIDWDVVTNYTDVVTTTLKTVTFPKVQEQVYLRNQGNANISYTIGSQSGTLTPGQSVTVNQDVSSYTVQAASGTHTFELRAKEKGTEIIETDNNLPSDVSGQLTSITSQLADKAKQTDLDITNTNVGQKASQTDLNNEISSRQSGDSNIQSQITNLVIASGSANAEVSQAHGDVNGVTFATLKEHTDNIENAINNHIDQKYKTKWQINNLSGGSIVVSSNRIVSTDILYASVPVTLSMSDYTLYRFAYTTYAYSDGTSPSDKGWNNKDVVIPAGTYYRILLARVTEVAVTNIRTDGIFLAFSMIYADSFKDWKKRIAATESGITTNATNITTINTTLNTQGLASVVNYVDKKYSYDWVVGRLDTSGVNTFIKTRVCTNTIIQASQDLIVSMNDYTKYRFGVFTYSDALGTSPVDTGWHLASYTIKQGTYFRLSLGYVTDGAGGNLTDPRGELFNTLAVSYTGALDNLKNLSSTILNTVNSLNTYKPPFISTLLPKKTRYLAHKGDSLNAPANTLPAFQLAGQVQKVWAIDGDVQQTSDGVLVMFHDDDLSTYTTGSGTVYSHTFAEIQTYTVKSGPNLANYPNLGIPTFEDYLKTCRKYGKVAEFELKAQMMQGNITTLINTLVGLIRAYGMEDSCIVTSMQMELLRPVRALSSRIHLMYVTSNNFSLTTTYFVPYLKELGNCGLNLANTAAFDMDKIKFLYQNEYTFGLWTLDNMTAATPYLDYVPDFITLTDLSNLQ